MRRAILSLAFLMACAPPGTSAPTTQAGEPVYPIMATSDLGTGAQRVLVAVYQGQARSMASPDRAVSLVFHSPEGGDPISVPGEFVWTIPEVQGLYRARVEFPVAGEWAVTVQGEGLEDPILDAFLVQEDPFTPEVGDPAPAADSLTVEDAPMEQITTDPDPDPRFYELSIAEAVSSGRPSVIVFATPRFCTSAVCGPTLDLVKEQADRYPEVNFLHVEVFDLDQAPDQLVPVPAVEEWRLPSEPWVFTVDEQGLVSGRFEGTVTPEELAEALGG